MPNTEETGTNKHDVMIALIKARSVLTSRLVDKMEQTDYEKLHGEYTAEIWSVWKEAIKG